MPEPTRQLAAIMFTDIVGYTALMGKDSKKALALVRQNKEIQKPLVEKNNGKWLKEMGDGAMVQFGSALDAVNCAMEIQRTSRADFEADLRIGIHLGDITFENNDVYGDGVNVAARLESIADPGGIYISDAIWKAIQGQTDIQVKDLGEIPLKNVSYELRTYAIQGVGLPVPAIIEKKPADVSASKRKFHLWAGVGAVLVIIILAFYLYPKFFQKQTDNTMDSDEISIVVLPFKNFSGDPELEPFCDGMTDEVISRLTKLKGISKVISMTSAMTYKQTQKTMPEIAAELGVTHILEASFQKSGDQIKITLQLIDGPSDNHYWSDEFIGVWGDIFGIQAKVAENVAINMSSQISDAEIKAIQKIPTSSEEAYELYLEGFYQYNLRTIDSWQKAEEIFENVLQIDPEFANAYAFLGYFKSGFAWSSNSERVTSPKEAISIALPNYKKALEIDPNNLIAQIFMAQMNLWYAWDFDQAEKGYKEILRLDPNYCWANFLIASGRFDEAVDRAEIEIKIDPFNPEAWNNWTLSLYFSKQPQQALKSMETRPNVTATLIEASRVYLYLEKYSMVIEAMEQIIKDWRTPRPLGTMTIAYYHLGELEMSNGLLEEIKALSEESSLGSPSFYLAMIYAQMGEIDTAFEWLDKAYQDHEVEMYWLKVEPPFEPLHDDPRWQVMLDKVGFPE